MMSVCVSLGLVTDMAAACPFFEHRRIRSVGLPKLYGVAELVRSHPETARVRGRSNMAEDRQFSPGMSSAWLVMTSQAGLGQ